MSILITGATGHLGGRLLKRLVAEGADCVVLTRHGDSLPGVRTVRCDVRDEAAVQAAVRAVRPRVVYHFAMTSGHPADSSERLESIQTAVGGTATVAEASAECGVTRFVFAGSFLTYRPQRKALVESDPFGPVSLRGAAKAGAAMWLGQFAATTGFPAVELRIFTVYGPGEAPRRFIPAVIRASREASPLPLRPLPSHDFVHVDDVVEAALLATTASIPAGAVFNIAGGRSWRNEEVVEEAARVLQRPIVTIPDAYPPSPADGSFWLGDITAARIAFGWKPKYSLGDGIRQTAGEICLGSA